MKEFSLFLNIVVYLSLFVALFYNVTDKIKRSRIEFVLLIIAMFWTLFISSYLIRNFTYMVNSPLNLKLNIYETVTNFIFLLYVVWTIFNNHCKNNNKKNNAISRVEDIGGGGIMNPKK